MIRLNSRLAIGCSTLSRAAVLAACMLGLQSAACRPNQPAGPAPIAPHPDEGFKGNAMKALDPCADQLQDLCGAMLLYYLQNHKLPPRLEDVRAFADLDQVLSFTCPETHKPFQYARDGLIAPDQNIRIFVYDAEPHEGMRRCICSTFDATQGTTEGRAPHSAIGAPRGRKTMENVQGADGLFENNLPEAQFKLFGPPGPPHSEPSPRTPPQTAPSP